MSRLGFEPWPPAPQAGNYSKSFLITIRNIYMTPPQYDIDHFYKIVTVPAMKVPAIRQVPYNKTGRQRRIIIIKKKSLLQNIEIWFKPFSELIFTGWAEQNGNCSGSMPFYPVIRSEFKIKN
jgi:hypothetical protein